MKISVLVEPADGGFRATSGGPAALSAEGATEEEAVQKLRDRLRARMAGGKVVEVDLGDEAHPLARWAGTWDANDPFIQEWEKGIEEHRRQCDEEAAP